MSAAAQPAWWTEERPDAIAPVSLDWAERYIISLSGGKDSLACALFLLEQGVSPDRIELWHQAIDGASDEGSFMDWPVTPRYCTLIAAHLGLPLLIQYREGGFRGELYRTNTTPAPVTFFRDDAAYRVDPVRAQPNTRRKFPAATADLSRRWCSSTLKIDVAARALTNDPTLQGTRDNPRRFVVISGERRAESPARSRYPEWEPHRTMSRARQVWAWRPLVGWSEADVWAIIRRWHLLPHPAYLLGYSRCSCWGCIFSSADQWRTMQALAPEHFERLAAAEEELRFTIDAKLSLREKAARGAIMRRPDDPWHRMAETWALHPDTLTLSDLTMTWPDNWYPAGAFTGSAGGSL